MSYDKVKAIKRASRQQNQDYGKAGMHADSRERRKPTMSHFIQDVEGSGIVGKCSICKKPVDLTEEPYPNYTDKHGEVIHYECYLDKCEEADLAGPAGADELFS